MSQNTHGPSTDPCAASLESEHLIPAQGKDAELPSFNPGVNGPSQDTAITEPPQSTLHLIPEQEEALELPSLNPSVNGTSQDTAVTEPPQSACLAFMIPPVGQGLQVQNGVQLPTVASREDTPKCSDPKKQSYKPRLEEQSSRVLNENEPPNLPPRVQEDLPIVTTPVTRAQQSQNGIRCTINRGASLEHPHKSLGPKKQSSNARLEKQSSRVSSNEAEPPNLPPGAREDCCVHCALALLFCQFLSLCHLFLDILTCGSCSAESAELCCSCCSMGACPDCSDSCSTDCGIVDACCESADCLEICMECCGLCFSS
ncbi:myoD family inhibitor [Discoglossus pictus]